ncbi:hypothetical protein [Rhizobium sp. LjRoot258]|uniref:hypothetical protein n=1 Tax=Rhizobium sp. LjRoot258 TaxID=3342299 RepID=UPI003ED0D9CA
MMLILPNENVSAVVAHQGRHFKQFPAPRNSAPEMPKRVWQSRKGSAVAVSRG